MPWLAHDPGGNHPPLIYPGNSDPRWTPALQLVKEGYTVVGAAKTSIFLPRQNFSSRVPRFPGFASFPLCALVFSPYPRDRTCPFHVFSVFPRLRRFRPFWPYWPFSLFRMVIFTISKRPNVPVQRFLRFPRLTRFRPFCPFWPFSLFRPVISPYPSDRMCPFHVFSVFSVFPRLARFRPFWPFWPFSLFRMVISPYPATERARSTFSPFSPTYTFSPVLPVLAVFAVPAGDFTVSRRPNVPVPRFLCFPPTFTFSVVLAVFAVSAGDFSVSRRPNVPVPRFLRFPRLARFRPSWPFWPFLLFRLVISTYPGDRTCPFQVFSVFPDLHVFARFAHFGRFSCFGW